MTSAPVQPGSASATTPAPAPETTAGQPFPTRYREGEARATKMGTLLKRIAGVESVDEEQMLRIGAALRRRDELGQRLAEAIRTRAGEPGRVSMSDLDTALHHGLDAVDDPAPALVDFMTTVEQVPEWVDWDLVEAGARAYRRFGRAAADVGLQLSLLGGYRFGGPTDLLVQTGALTGGQSRRRLGETQRWVTSLTQPGGMRPHAEGWRLTLHVRAMHALVNHGFEPRWDVDRWGLPINQADQASTLGLFDGVVLIGVRALGVPVSRHESAAVMHLWRYVGWLMGVDEEFLVETERERHRLNYHVLISQGPLTEAGGQLTRSAVDAQLELDFRTWGPLAPLRARYERERLLSMLTVFLGPTSMKELGLPLRPPWAHPLVIAGHTVRHQVLRRLPGGRRVLERWGDRVVADLMVRYFGDDAPEAAALR